MITLLTDFGTFGYFVPAVKGAILSLHPSATLIDITHEVPPQDIRSAAFILNACYRDFPDGTVHLVVVDPGVGSSRRPIVVRAGAHTFVGPDNGVFSFLYRKNDELSVYEVTRTDLFRQPLSTTFHGRDVFGPIAAHLDQGLHAMKLGPGIFDFQRLDIPEPHLDLTTGEIIGEVIYVDRFGNCVTNFSEAELARSPAVRLRIGSSHVATPGSHFAELQGGGLIAYPGSAGFWEIGLWCQSAAALLNVTRGAPVVLESSADGKVR
ncbi:MAG: SAM-dependent chlorinase/fluorinase [Acidobacteriota bacterium]